MDYLIEVKRDLEEKIKVQEVEEEVKIQDLEEKQQKKEKDIFKKTIIEIKKGINLQKELIYLIIKIIIFKQRIII